jgi:hypothetical protein
VPRYLLIQGVDPTVDPTESPIDGLESGIDASFQRFEPPINAGEPLGDAPLEGVEALVDGSLLPASNRP